LKKYASHFFNSNFVETEEKKVAYAITGNSGILKPAIKILRELVLIVCCFIVDLFSTVDWLQD
jgi:flavoprotein